ncbi:hypothetical protein [Xanthomonas hortorum]|uniref:hypothetical protein n=1 Tax=Xanthomonas hortorum TaxID=56454 RepID=UPI0029362813|nr:hypothetical protein [Xanthomonas hortorum]MDV2452475.1 hypothetical protein [Xanthomonas hortorum NBC5720]
MTTSNKTIYFIQGDLDAPPPPEKPDSPEAILWLQKRTCLRYRTFCLIRASSWGTCAET